MQKVEEASLKDLEKIVGESKNYGLKLVVIGGYAVKAYTTGYRATKDIDCVILKKEIGGLIALLKDLSYEVGKTEFGLAGKRKFNDDFIDLHISTGGVFDISTKKTYSVDEETFKRSKLLEISGFFKETEVKVKAHVISLEELLILKLMTKRRDKDMVDIISLAIDREKEINHKLFVENCSKRSLNRHIRDNILSLIGVIRSGEMKKVWLSMTGRRLMRKTEIEIVRLLRTLENELR